MKQMICRITDKSADVQILVKSGTEEIWKTVSLDKFASKIEKYVRKNKRYTKPELLDSRIIAIGTEMLVYRTEEHRRIVIYGRKAHEINYPPCIYFVAYRGSNIDEIRCFTYTEYKGADTKLYLMPMPNMTVSERMCIGTGSRKIINRNVIEAVEQIVDAEYTHDSVDNLKEQWSTKRWFAHLKRGHVPVDQLIPAGILREKVEVIT